MSSSKKGALTGGIILILLGVLLLLENVYPEFSISRVIFKYWPLLLIYIGIRKAFLYFNRRVSDFERRSFSAVLLYLFLGVLFLLNNLGIFYITLKVFKFYWPVVFIIMGLGKFVDYFFRKSVKIKGSEIVFLIFLVLLAIFVTIFYKSKVWFYKHSECFPEKIEREIKRSEFKEFVEKFRIENSVSIKGVKNIVINSENVNLNFLKGNTPDKLKIVEVVKGEKNSKLFRKNKLSNEVKRDGEEIIINTPRVIGGDLIIFEKIFVPEGLRLKVNSHGGDIVARGIKTDFSVDRSLGKVDFGEIYGKVKIKNVSGSIFLNGINGDCSVKINSGSLSAKNVKGNFSITEVFSNVTADGVLGDLKLNMDYGNGNFSSIGGFVFLDSINCDISLKDVYKDLVCKSKFGNLNVYGVKGDVSFEIVSNSDVFEVIDGSLIGKCKFCKFNSKKVGKNVNIRGENCDFKVSGVSGSTYLENKFGKIVCENCGKDVVIKNFGGNIEYNVGDSNFKRINLFSKNGSITLFLSKDIKCNLLFSAILGKIFLPDIFTGRINKKNGSYFFKSREAGITRDIECTTKLGNIYLNLTH